MNTERIISVIGSGYVGLPVAVAFGKVRRTVGFDINPLRIKELKSGYDRTGEVTTEDPANSGYPFHRKGGRAVSGGFPHCCRANAG